MAEIELKNVLKKFGNVVAVDHVDLMVKDKEFLVLLGPSGCGKTTILRMIAGLETCDFGDIYIGGSSVKNKPPRARDIAMVFQNYALYPHMDVYRNMSFSLRLQGIPKDRIDQRVKGAATILGIEDLLERKPKQLSGGQRQRVAMGRAIVREPQAYLFDEPLSNLDAKLRVQMRLELASIHDRLEGTIVYVTHDQIEAMTLADRIVIMNRGQIVQIGRSMEVYDNPRNLFVAGFIGSPTMNFFDCFVAEENGALCIKNEWFKLIIPSDLQDRYSKAQDKETVLGIRPEHIFDSAITNMFPGGEVIQVTGEIVEPIGSAIILVASLGAIKLTASLDPKTGAKPHTKIQLIVDMNHMHLFEKSTGEAY